MKFEIEYITNIGLKREQNEDSILIGNKILSSINMKDIKKIVFNDDTSIFSVADGMEGYNKGEVASFLF